MAIRYIVPKELKWLYDDNDNKILIPRILDTIFCDILARKDEGRGTRYLIKFSTASGDIIKGCHLHSTNDADSCYRYQYP